MTFSVHFSHVDFLNSEILQDLFSASVTPHLPCIIIYPLLFRAEFYVLYIISSKMVWKCAVDRVLFLVSELYKWTRHKTSQSTVSPTLITWVTALMLWLHYPRKKNSSPFLFYWACSLLSQVVFSCLLGRPYCHYQKCQQCWQESPAEEPTGADTAPCLQLHKCSHCLNNIYSAFWKRYLSFPSL